MAPATSASADEIGEDLEFGDRGAGDVGRWRRGWRDLELGDRGACPQVGEDLELGDQGLELGGERSLPATASSSAVRAVTVAATAIAAIDRSRREPRIRGSEEQ
ncbi:MAG TPA: hypothetical protein VHW23_32295 [Kofleriaceae bacterium]|jgi:hypothetical protein|nr:hypothetical protein [Kofleriaceae bacterium]